MIAKAQTEPPQFITVDGRLYDSSTPTDPLLDNSVVMRIQVLNPAKTCILYEEQQTVSTLSSSGYFNVRVGSPTAGAQSLKRTALDVGNAMSTVFQNQSSPIAGNSSGGVGCAYTPSQGETRYFRFIVTPSTTGVTSQLSPDMTVDSVPQALVAESFQGLMPDEFIQVNADVTQAKLNSLLGGSYSALSDLISGTSTAYLQNTVNGTVIPSRPSDPAAPAAGQIWYDTTSNELKYFDGTIVQTLASAAGGDPTKLPLAGGTMLGAINMGSFDITSTGHITQSAQRTFRFGGYTGGQEATLIATPLVPGQEGTAWYNTTTDKLMYWDGTGSQEVLTVSSANSLVPNCNADESLQMSVGPVYVWSCVPTTDSTKLALAGGTLTGDLNLDNEQELRLSEADGSGTDYVAFKALTTLGASYTLTFPPDDGSAAGQVLTTDGSGVLTWTTPAAVGETNTVSNQGAGGVGVYKQKTGVDFELRNINAASNKVTVALDAGNNEIDINVDETNFALGSIPNTAAGNIAATNAQAAINELDTEKVASASNQGAGGVGVYKQKTGVDLEFKNINAGSNKVTVTNDAGNNEIDINVDETNFALGSIPNTAAGNIAATNAQAAINELDTEKVAKAGDTMTGALNIDNEQELRLSEADGSGANYVALKALTTLGANYTLTFPPDDGTAAGQVLTTDGNGILTWTTLAAVGETNTASNQGAAGVGVYDAKSGVDLQFRNINAASNKVTVALDAGNKEIDINVDETNFALGSIPNTAAGNIAATNAQSAINELDTEKVAKAGDSMTGTLTMNAQNQVRYADSAGGEYAAIQAPATIGANYVLTLPDNDGTAAGQVLTTDGSGVLTWTTPAAVGETNTVSNQGAGGVGVYKQKTGVDFELRNINAASNKVTVALDAGNNEIDINVDETNFALGSIPNTAAGNIAATNAQSAINELDTEKVAKAGDTMTGTLAMDNQNAIRFIENGSTNYIAIRGPSATTGNADFTLTLPADDGANGQYLMTDGSGALSWVTPAGVGETNTASNQGVAGVGVYDTKSGVDLQFRNINAASNKVTVALDAGNKEIDINVDETNFALGSIPNTAAGNIAATNAQSAINELDTEKVAKAGDSMTGTLTMNAQNQVRYADSAGGEYAAIQAPATIGANYVLTLPDNDGTAAGQVLTTDGSGVLTWTTPAAAGEVNTVSNQGAAGVGVYKQKTGVDFELRNINAASNKVTVALDAGNNEIDINVDETNFALGSIPNTAAGNIAATNAQSAINELDTEKVAKAGDSMTGTLTMNAQNQVRYADSAGGEYAAIQAPATIGANYVLTLPDNDGTAAGQVLTTDGSGVLTWTTPAAVGETNTVSNQGAGGVGVYKQKTGVDFELRNINAASNKVTVALDAGNNEIDINVDETNFALGSIPNTAAGNIAATNAQAAINELDTEKVAKAGDTMTGALNIDNEQELRLSEADGSGANYVALKSPTTLGANYSLTFPVDDGTANQVLTTDGSGVLTWTTPAAAGEVNTVSNQGAAGVGVYKQKTGVDFELRNINAASNKVTVALDAGNNEIDINVDETNFALGSIPNTAAGNIAATNAQAAINELDTEKVAKAGDTMTGTLAMDNQQAIRFVENGSTNYIAIRGPAATTGNADFTLTLPADDGTNGQYLMTDGSGALSWVTPAGVGETNTASNVTGSTGVGLFKQKSTFDLEFKSLLPGSNKLSISGGASDVTLDVVETNLNLGNIPNTAAGNIAATNAQSAINELDTEKVAKAGDTMTGALNIDNEQELRLSEADGSGANYVALKSPATLGANYSLTFPVDDGTANQVLTTDGSGVLTWTTPASAGEVNTASNQGAAGVGVYDAKSGVDLQFRNINAASNKVTVALDAGNKEIDINVDETNFALGSIPNTAAGNIAATNAQSAINELDTEKVAKAGDSMTGTLTMNAQNQVRYADSAGGEYAAIQAPATIGANYVLTLPDNDGTAAGQVLTTDGNGILTWTTPAAAGEVNTVSNQGAAGVGVYKQKTGVDFELRNINAASNKVTVVLDAGNNEIDINVDETNFALGSIPNTAAGNIAATNAQSAINELDTEKVAKAGDTMTGALNIDNEQELRLSEADGSGANYVALKSPTTLGANYSLTFPVDDGTANQVLTTDGSGVLTWTTPASAGEVNTASNQGAAGVGVYDAKSGVDLQFRNINAASNKVTVALDAGNKEIDINVDETNFALGSIPNTAAGNIAATNAQSAINELDTEKVAKAGDSMTGTLTMNAQNQVRYADSAGGEYAAIQAPATIGANYVLTLPDNDGTAAGQVLTTDGSGVLTWTTPAAAGEVNTVSNQGAAGVGVYKQKTGVDFELRNINAASNKVTVALDAGNNEIDINVDETNFALGSIPNTAAGNIAATNAQSAINELDTEKVAKTGDTMTGALNIDNEQELRLSEADGSGANYVALKALTTLGANYTLTFPPDDGTAAGQVLTTDGAGVLTWTTPASAGEVNTASNQGAAGVGVYDAKSGVDLQFRNINAASNKVTVALDAGNKEIDINVDETNFALGSIPNTAAGNIAATNAQAAINELDTEKVAKAGDSMTGNLTMNAQSQVRYADSAGGEYAAIQAPATIGANYVLTLPDNDGTAAGQVLTTDGNGVLTWTTPAAVGETNTVSNQGAGGVGVYKQKTGVDFELRNINAASNKVTVALDAGNNEIDINVDETNFALGSIPNTAAGNIAATNAQAAINELDTEKVAKAGDTMTGALNIDNEQELRLSEADGSGANYVALKALTTLGANYTLTFPPDDGSAAGQVLTTDGAGVLTWTTPASAGEVNTASNQGAAGVGVYDAKSGVDLQFRNINAASNKVTVALDAGNKEIDINVDETNFALGSIPNTAAGNIAATNAQAAINELDTEKVAKAGDTMTGQLVMGPKGVAAGDGGSVAFKELAAGGTNVAVIRSPDALAADYVLTLPGDDGTSGQVLQTDGAGVLSWTTVGTPGANSLDFTHFSDTMALDASTTITADGSEVFTLTNTGTGDSFVVNDQVGDTTPFVIDASGNVGVGTTVPSNQMHLRTSDAGTNTTTNILRLEHETSGTPAASYGTGILFTGESTTTSNQDMAQVDAIWTTSTHASRASAIRFSTVTAGGALAEKMRIDGSGFVGINNTAPSVALDVTGDIEYSGTLTDVSDRRLKENILPLDGALEKLVAIEGVSFVMKNDPAKRIEIGVIAQDVEKVMPELVRTKNDALQTKSVNYMGFMGYIIEAIKELYYNLSQKDKQHDEELKKLQLQNQQLLELVQKQQQQIDQIQQEIKRSPTSQKK